ncbi:MAG: hypothetical protein ACRDPD_03315 [Streptosporangiaceae bacterium]
MRGPGDPAVATYGGKFAHEGVKGVSVVQADIRDVAGVLAHPGVTEVIDLAEPVLVVLGFARSRGPSQSGERVKSARSCRSTHE